MTYQEFKSSFPKSGTLTIESLHILNHIGQLIICPSIGKYQMLGAISIDVRNLANFDEEKFTKYVMPYEPDIYMKGHFIFPSEENPIFHWNILYGSVTSLQFILSHADKVIQTLFSMPPETMIEDNVFYEWCDRGTDLLSNLIGKISISFQSLSEKLNKHSETRAHLNNLGEAIAILDEHKAMFIKSPDKRHYQTLIQILQVGLSNLLPYLAAKNGGKT